MNNIKNKFSFIIYINFFIQRLFINKYIYNKIMKIFFFLSFLFFLQQKKIFFIIFL